MNSRFVLNKFFFNKKNALRTIAFATTSIGIYKYKKNSFQAKEEKQEIIVLGTG
jgi:hypothetical protein